MTVGAHGQDGVLRVGDCCGGDTDRWLAALAANGATTYLMADMKFEKETDDLAWP